MKTIAFHNLGCKVNSYELDVMQQIMREKGFEIVPFDQKADVYVINTCTVTNIADRKSRQMLHRAKQKNPKAVVVAVGCYVQTDLEGALKDPAIDLVIGNNRKKDIAQILEEYLSALGTDEPSDVACGTCHAEGFAPDKTLGGTTVLDIAHEKAYEEMQLKTTAEHTRAYVKIQDGCNQFCSYCAIPLARGRVRSRKAEDIISEIRGIVAAGYLEIVLTGIHVSSYGIDFARNDDKSPQANASAQGESATARDYRGETHLFDLIEKIHEIPGLERIRVSSMEPRIVTAKAAKRLAALPKVCPHFHLSLQSGCDATLKRMNRHYTAQQYLESVQALRDAYAPRVPAITTDVIVGFPGETEEEFETTQAFLQKVGFYEMHVFKYSKRKGTRAAVMPDQVPDPVKSQRSDVLLDLEREQSIAFRKNKLGQTAEVLFEEEKVIGGKPYLLGHTMDYVKVALPLSKGTEHPRSGELVPMALQEFLTEEILLGHEATLF
ncbi:MAG: MiaB/RimO family radical SAM methylthiotransferase [Acetatifactor sp.]|nr:MiaB/RimO family radical SAM methylthiotransferase [Acetatifactor sp.]